MNLGRQSASDSSPLGPKNTASSSSIRNDRYRYDVFISFRGVDTRNSFVDHLYARLIRKGISVFKDDRDLEEGEFIPSRLQEAIRGSRLSVIVFSKDYASSKWCLREMVAIADCHRRSTQIVFPVFYDVDPSDVRHQRGPYANAFRLHTARMTSIVRRKKFLVDQQHDDQWPSVMKALANIVGCDARNKPEVEQIENIVQAVIKKLGHRLSRMVDDDLIGIQPRVQSLKSILKLNSENDNFRVLGICGMTGIGKTTHAAVLYDNISYTFGASCFIENVSKVYRNGGAIAIHKQILSQTFEEMNLDTYSPSEISGIVRNRLHKIKVLLVLDNVDQLEQLQELAINPKLLFKGSRMVITTTDEHILKVYGANAVHKVSLLNDNDARELFYRKAFKSEEESSICVELIPRVLDYVQGLPLAITLIGSFLCTRDATQWRDALHRLENSPDDKMMNILQISVDGLQYEEKEIFLHIACFFAGEREDYVKRILDCCGLFPHIGISRLVEKSLITIRDQEIHMHEMLQELGKKIVRGQSPEEPELWSRIWLYEDFFRIMMTETGTNKLKAIVLKKEDVSECSIDELSKMKNLRLLILYHRRFSGSLDFLSHELRYLLWHDYPFTSLPSRFTASRLVELNLPNSSISSVWEGRKRLDLSGCTKLSEIHPSIGLLENLAFLSLRNCSNLVSINFGSESNLSSLKVVYLSGCTELKNMPDFTSATNLEYLEIEGCTSLSLVHESIGVLGNLTFLSLRDCINLVSIPNNINTMTSLQTLDLRGCKKLTDLPLGQAFNSSSHLESLIFLDIGFCNLLELPDAIGELRCLERLNLQGNNFVSIPPYSMEGLHCLSYLNLSHCHKLETFPILPSRNDSSGGRYFKTVSGSRDHRSGLYAFDCPKLGGTSSMECVWLTRLTENPHHFRCGFDIVVPWNSKNIPLWFVLNEELEEGSVIRIKDFNMEDKWIAQAEGLGLRIDFNMDDNWIGFAFCVVFEVDSGPVVSTSPLPHPFYLSFESEYTEEYFDMPLNLEMKKIDGLKHLWIIYISRQHCHFVKTGAHITFKAHPNVKINKWGIRSIFKQGTNYLQRIPHNIDFVCVEKSNTSSWPKFQLPYNWLVTEGDENENIEAKAKENNLANLGLLIR